jgi:hypothetical protein
MLNVNDDIIKLQIAKNLLKEKLEDKNYFQNKIEAEKETNFYSLKNPYEANLEDVLVEIQALEHFIRDIEDFLKEDAYNSAREQAEEDARDIREEMKKDSDDQDEK